MASTSYLLYRFNRIGRKLRREVARRLYRDPHGDVGRSMLVAGAARSGTTWVADLVQSRSHCRIMFEPFLAGTIKQNPAAHGFLYLRPEQDDEPFLGYCESVFTGRIRDPWIDRQVETVRPQCRLIKAVRANLCLKWIHDRFPQVPLVLLVRHPAAIVASRMQLGWNPAMDIGAILQQSTLVDDFLADRMDWIKSLSTPAELRALIWSLSYLVPLRQFRPGELHLFAYEDLCGNPDVEVPRLFAALGQPFDPAVLKVISRPSTTATRNSAMFIGSDPITRWRSVLSGADVRDVEAVVSGFGLDHLYGDGPIPCQPLEAAHRAIAGAAR